MSAIGVAFVTECGVQKANARSFYKRKVPSGQTDRPMSTQMWNHNPDDFQVIDAMMYHEHDDDYDRNRYHLKRLDSNRKGRQTRGSSTTEWVEPWQINADQKSVLDAMTRLAGFYGSDGHVTKSTTRQRLQNAESEREGRDWNPYISSQRIRINSPKGPKSRSSPPRVETSSPSSSTDARANEGPSEATACTNIKKVLAELENATEIANSLQKQADILKALVHSSELSDNNLRNPQVTTVLRQIGNAWTQLGLKMQYTGTTITTATEALSQGVDEEEEEEVEVEVEDQEVEVKVDAQVVEEGSESAPHNQPHGESMQVDTEAGTASANEKASESDDESIMVAQLKRPIVTRESSIRSQHDPDGDYAPAEESGEEEDDLEDDVEDEDEEDRVDRIVRDETQSQIEPPPPVVETTSSRAEAGPSSVVEGSHPSPVYSLTNSVSAASKSPIATRPVCAWPNLPRT